MPRMSFGAALLGATLLTSVSSTHAAAQLGSYNPLPGPQGTFVIKNAHIFPVSGPEITNGSVVIAGGKIQAIGANVTVPPFVPFDREVHGLQGHRG